MDAELPGVGEVVGQLLSRLADELLPGRDDEADLLDREAHVLGGAARRLRGGGAPRGSEDRVDLATARSTDR